MKKILFLVVVVLLCGCRQNGTMAMAGSTGATVLNPEEPTKFRLSNGTVVTCSKLWTDHGGAYLNNCEDGNAYLAQTNLEEIAK